MLAAEGDESDLAIFFEAAPHVVVQIAKGGVSSTLEISSDASNMVTNVTFRLGGGVKGPALDHIWGRPRPVVWAAALVPLNESSVIGTQFIETAGGGAERLEFSKYALEYQTSAIAGIGLEFVTTVFDYDITVPPGIQTLHLVARYAGEATLETQGGLNNQTVSLSGKKKMTQHFLGPALRIDTPSAEFQGLTVDFFLDVGLLVDISGSRRELVSSDEFKGDFRRACRELGVRQTKTKPRHPFTNGCVEPVQGTLLHEHWRIEFRRCYFTRVGQIERSLHGALRFYSFDWPHRGYRARGRTPASILWGANDEKRQPV